jgi:hypothetical protein
LIRVARFIAPITFDYWIQILKRKDIKFSAKELKDAFYLAFGGVNRLGIFSRTLSKCLMSEINISIHWICRQNNSKRNTVKNIW